MRLWYVVQTKPRKQDQAVGYLISKQIETFNPLMKQVSTRNGKIVTALKPLFPNYLFCKFDYREDFALLKWGRGIHRIVGFGEYPVPLSEEVIGIIRERTDKHNVIKKAFHLNHRDTVRIVSGPLKDLVGIFDRWVSDSDRVRILLNLIGNGAAVEMHYSMVEKVS